MLKRMAAIETGSGLHWVGDGFPVNSVFSYHKLGKELSPFLLLDYAAPTHFEPAATPRGVGQHPHRGFETVTIVYAGEVSHKDNAGNAGTIGPGDVQWMTAGKGIIHEEFHSQTFTEKGGDFEMVQLWVNLPAKDKQAPPNYQDILNRDIPAVQLPGGAGTLRVISGRYGGAEGPANTFTPVDLWDAVMAENNHFRLPLRDGYTAAILAFRGDLTINGSQPLKPGQLALLDREGDGVELQTKEAAKFLVLHAQPIDEPIAGYGPFVMNTRAEIHQAISDFNAGLF